MRTHLLALFSCLCACFITIGCGDPDVESDQDFGDIEASDPEAFSEDPSIGENPEDYFDDLGQRIKQSKIKVLLSQLPNDIGPLTGGENPQFGESPDSVYDEPGIRVKLSKIRNIYNQYVHNDGAVTGGEDPQFGENPDGYLDSPGLYVKEGPKPPADDEDLPFSDQADNPRLCHFGQDQPPFDSESTDDPDQVAHSVKCGKYCSLLQ